MRVMALRLFGANHYPNEGWIYVTTAKFGQYHRLQKTSDGPRYLVDNDARVFTIWICLALICQAQIISKELHFF